jgi:hypothetical protein
MKNCIIFTPELIPIAFRTQIAEKPLVIVDVRSPTNSDFNLNELLVSP